MSPESERKGLRKCAEGVEAGLLVHLRSVAETRLWMHKRPWPEGKAKLPDIHNIFLVYDWLIGSRLILFKFGHMIMDSPTDMLAMIVPL